MWAWLTALTRNDKDVSNGCSGKRERRAKVTRAEITTLFAKELSRRPRRR